MELTVYIICYNEEYLLPYTIQHYRERFPECKIVVYDNFSNDRTAHIAEVLDCKIMQFYTGNKLSDQAFIDVKNNCWKDGESGWKIIADTDEWLDIWPDNLKHQEEEGVSIIKTVYYDMIGVIEGLHPDKMEHGIFYPEPGKYLCFDSRKIKEINYDYGCHSAMPFGDVKFSLFPYRIYHYKWLSLNYVLKRYKIFGERLSSHNLKNKLSFHYLFPSWKIKKTFKNFKSKAVKIQ